MRPAFISCPRFICIGTHWVPDSHIRLLDNIAGSLFSSTNDCRPPVLAFQFPLPLAGQRLAAFTATDHNSTTVGTALPYTADSPPYGLIRYLYAVHVALVCAVLFWTLDLNVQHAVGRGPWFSFVTRFATALTRFGCTATFAWLDFGRL